MKFEVDMGECTTSWRFNEKAYECHAATKRMWSTGRERDLITKL
jgi:hypothetical protein